MIIGLGAATAGMAAVSLRANYLFGYGFGRTPETANMFGWANVATDMWKVFGLITITSLWRAKQNRAAMSLISIWGLCLLWGFAGAIGVYAQDRTALIRGREAATATYKDAELDLAEIEGRLKALRTHRSPALVEAAIASVLARPISVNPTHPRQRWKALDELREARSLEDRSVPRRGSSAGRTCRRKGSGYA